MNEIEEPSETEEPKMRRKPSEECNPERDDVVERLVHSFVHPAEGSLVLLGEDEGSSGSSLVDAAIARLQDMEGAPSLLRFDLEGFEPDGVSFSIFQSYQQEKWERNGAGASLPASLVAPEATTWKAAFFSLVVNLDAAAARAGELSLLLSTWEAEAERGDRSAFIAALRALTAERPCICHLSDPGTIPDTLLWFLITEAEACPGFLLVLSGSPWEIPGRVLPSQPASTLRISVPALSSSELRIAIERDFGTDAWVLFDECGTVSLPDVIEGTVARFLALAGLCGEIVPADVLLDHLGIGEEAKDTFLDYFDQSFVEQGLFDDLEYRHPAFPRYTTYRFASPLLACATSCGVPETELARLRDSFFSFLKEHVKPEFRGASGLLLAVAPEWARAERESLSWELAWWVGGEEAPELEDLLSAGVATGRLEPESLWRVIEETTDHWTSGLRRLALLEVYERQPGRMPAHRAGEFHALRATALYDLGRYSDSFAESRMALNLLSGNCGHDARLAAGCHAIAGLISLDGGELLEARARVGSAVEAAGAATGGVSSQATEEIRTIGDSLCSVESELLLRSALENILSICRCSLGFEGRRAADVWKGFADVLRQAGSPLPARLSLDQALAISRRFAGSQDIQLAIVLKNLAELHHGLGETQEARARLEEALSIEAAVFGESDEQVVVLRNNLLDLLLAVGDLDAARKYLTQALLVVRSISGGKDSERLVLLKHLADVLHRLGDDGAVLELLTEAVGLEELLHGPMDPGVGVMLKQLADVHRQVGNRDGFVFYRLRALRVEEAIYGTEDRRILPNLKILEPLLREEGDQPAADSFRERVRLIESRLVPC
jgi:tetratricopeptide (TPR) repeat protein